MNWFAVGGVVAVLFYGFVLAVAFRRPMAEAIRQLMSLRRATLGALAILAVVATVEAQKPGDGDGGGTNRMMNAGRSLSRATSLIGRKAMLRSGSPAIPDYTVSDEELALGYRLLYTTNDVAHDYSMPEGAKDLGNLYAHGAGSDFGMRRLELDGWCFPFGPSNTAHSVFWWTLGGALKTAPLDAEPLIAAGPPSGEGLAVEGESMAWWNEDDPDSASIVWKNMFATIETVETNNYEIFLRYDGYFETWSNEFGRIYKMISMDDKDGDGVPDEFDPYPRNANYGVAGWHTRLETPSIVMRGGNMKEATFIFDPPAPVSEGATATLGCISGHSRVSLWTSTNKTEAFQLPVTLTPGESRTFWIEGISASDCANDIAFTVESSVGIDSAAKTNTMTVARVELLGASCGELDVGSRWTIFAGEMQHPFSLSEPLYPGEHLAIPFEKVAAFTADGLVVNDFSIELLLELAPSNLDTRHLEAEWETIGAYPAMSGSLVQDGSLEADFQNPTQGGVYRFRGRVDGSPWTECNVVLPTAGASIDADFAEDFEDAWGVVLEVDSTWCKYSLTPVWAFFNMYYGYNGDYRGRVDAAANATVRRYNKINENHMGAVTTLHGVPIRLAKLSNFLVNYTLTSLQVNGDLRHLSRLCGTLDDDSATMSWNAGESVALNGEFNAETAAMATNAWAVSDSKVKRLWPNTSPADNRLDSSQIQNYDENYSAPPFIEEQRNKNNN